MTAQHLSYIMAQVQADQRRACTALRLRAWASIAIIVLCILVPAVVAADLFIWRP